MLLSLVRRNKCAEKCDPFTFDKYYKIKHSFHSFFFLFFFNQTQSISA